VSRRRRERERAAPAQSAPPEARVAPPPALRPPGPAAAPATAPILIATVLVIAIGLALRLWRIGAGLPDFLDEAIPWKTAFRMWTDEHRVDWNPHFFNYPSLTIYLCLFLQKLLYAVGHALGRYPTPADFLMDYELDPSPMVIAARTLGVAFDAVTLVMVARIGERLHRGAGVAAAALVALAPTMIATARAIYTDTYMTAFALAALERMLAFRDQGKPAQLAAAAVLAGLAAGSKYPGALALVPLAWVLIERRGRHGALPWALACVAAAGVFFITTPFALLDFATFRRDLGFEGFHMASGHLGSAGRHGFLFQLRTLRGDVGWLGLALLPVSLVLTVAAPRARGDRVTLWLFLLPVGAAISLARVEAGRYLTPVVPVAAALVVCAALDLAARPRLKNAREQTVVSALAAAVLVLPMFPGGLAAGGTGADDTQAQTRRWCEAHLPDSVLILREGYTGNLFTRQRAAAVQRTRGFQAASATRRERLLDRRTFDAADLPLITAGDASLLLDSGAGANRLLRVFDQPADINQIFYDLRVLHGVDYVLTSGAARSRFGADTVRYAAQARFYRFLDRDAEHVASFHPGRGVSGPEIEIYRIGDRARAAIVRAGPLHALWWAESIPAAFRNEFEVRAVDPARHSGGALTLADGTVAPWVEALGGLFDKDIRPFARLLSWELSHFDRYAAAAPWFEAIHVMHPDDVDACLAYARCVAALQRWPEVEVSVSSTLATVTGESAGLAELHYLRGLARAGLGRADDARGDFETARAGAAAGSDLQAAADQEARRLGTRKPAQRLP